MNPENIFVKGTSRYTDRDDSVEFLKNHLNTYMYNQLDIETQVNNSADKLFSTNIEFWQAALENECYAEQVIKLQNFHLLEWIPIAPGLFHTDNAEWHRREAQSNAVRILEENSIGPTWMNSIVNPSAFTMNKIFKKTLEELKENPNKKIVIEYNPDGKESMIKGGVGSIRLASKLINGKECYLLGASSTGVSHEGIPIILETFLYQQAISKIKDTGGFIVNIIGKLKIIPKELSIIKSYREIPRFCLFAEDIEYIQASDSNFLMSSVAISYYPSDNFASKRLSFCSFTPDGKDKQLVGAIDWLQEYAVKYSKSSSPILEGDFDEFKTHFDNVDFPIIDVSNGKISKETFIKYKEFFHLQVDEVIMGDKFENISNSNIVSRSENVSVNTSPESRITSSTPANSELKKSYQALVAAGKIQECLEKMLELFKNKDNKYALNEVIMYNSQFSQLKSQENFNTISQDDASRERARLTQALIDFIDKNL